MKKISIPVIFSVSVLFSVFACGNDESANEKQKVPKTENGTSATTDGTTSSIGSNPTNSTGSTGKEMENRSTSTSDSLQRRSDHTTNSGESTK
jgi:hypothetical protein